jgi:hypothetical protein
MIDLQEQTRRDYVYNEIDEVVDKLNIVSKNYLGMSLLWAWIWDDIKYQLDYYRDEPGEELMTNPDLTEKQVWDKLWDTEGFSLEYGTEALSEQILEWMIDQDILVSNEMEE